MIEFRQLSNNDDFEAAISLLNRNLNKRHSRSFLNWKHYQNPFGTPLGAVATLNNEIIGVVFYLRYNFKNNNKIIKCLRPIDGCTEKIHRGQGILKKLMKYCLDLYKNDYDILIATPNRYSYPEFLKLGWEDLSGNYSYKIGLISPFISSKDISILELKPNSLENVENTSSCYFVTQNIPGFIKWRYIDGLDKNYIIKKVKYNNEVGYIIYYIKKAKKIKYIVLCDFIGSKENLQKSLKAICKFEKIYIVYYLHNDITKHLQFILVKNQNKPRITIRTDNSKINTNMILALSDLTL